jgi:hypothetical protein
MTPEEIESLVEPFYGYLELGMDDEANDVLDALPPETKSHPLVLSARLDQLMLLKRWEDGVILGQSLYKKWPQHFDFWIHTAFCLHEMKRTAEAKQTLLSAPEAIREAALYSYNLACYEAQLCVAAHTIESDSPARFKGLWKQPLNRKSYQSLYGSKISWPAMATPMGVSVCRTLASRSISHFSSFILKLAQRGSHRFLGPLFWPDFVPFRQRSLPISLPIFLTRAGPFCGTALGVTGLRILRETRLPPAG